MPHRLAVSRAHGARLVGDELGVDGAGVADREPLPLDAILHGNDRVIGCTLHWSRRTRLRRRSVGWVEEHEPIERDAQQIREGEQRRDGWLSVPRLDLRQHRG